MSKKKTKDTSQVNSLMNVNQFYGCEFDFKQPTELKVRGYFKGFIKVEDYEYHIAELLLVATDKGPLEQYFSDIEENGKASFYFPFSKKSANNDDLVAIFNKGINDWEKMKEVIDEFRILPFDTERELLDWLFGFDTAQASTELELNRETPETDTAQ